MGRKTTICILQETNCLDCTQENLEMIKKEGFF